MWGTTSKIKTKEFFSAKGESLGKEEYFYDEQGNQTQWIQTKQDGSELHYKGVSTYQLFKTVSALKAGYDSNNNLLYKEQTIREKKEELQWGQARVVSVPANSCNLGNSRQPQGVFRRAYRSLQWGKHSE